MNLRAVCLSLASILCMSLAAADDHDAAARAAEERALRAQIDQMDTQLQDLETKLHALEAGHPDETAGRDALRDQIHHLDRDQELLENRLRELVGQDPPGQHNLRAPTPAIDEPASTPAAPPAPATSPMPSPASPPLGVQLRSAADPAPYEKAAGDRLSMFYYNPYRWIPVGTRQLAVYTNFDEAYLLDLGMDCPALLTAKRIRIENFSTKVYVGHDGVIADGVRCPIAMIRVLSVNRLPN